MAARRELAWAAGDGGAARRAGGKPVVAAAVEDRRIIQCVLDGRSGNMPILPNGALRVDEMRENLQEIDKYELGSRKKEQSLNRKKVQTAC